MKSLTERYCDLSPNIFAELVLVTFDKIQEPLFRSILWHVSASNTR